MLELLSPRVRFDDVIDGTKDRGAARVTHLDADHTASRVTAHSYLPVNACLQDLHQH